MSVESKRELIMTEVRRRLALIYPEAQIDRGFTASQVDTYDHFFIFDLPESLETGAVGRGQYICTFPISVSYWLQCDPKEMFTIGNEHMERIRLALELDEHFAGPDGKRLCISYRLDEGALLWYDEGVLDIELMFMFEYVKDAGWLRKPFA